MGQLLSGNTSDREWNPQAIQEMKAFLSSANTLYPEENVQLLIPKRKLIERKQGQTHEITKKLFPGYVLIKTVMTTERLGRDHREI